MHSVGYFTKNGIRTKMFVDASMQLFRQRLSIILKKDEVINVHGCLDKIIQRNYVRQWVNFSLGTSERSSSN